MPILARFRSIKGLFRGINPRDLDPDPVIQVQAWLRDAEKARLHLHNAMALATVSPDGQPSARMMLLKGVDEKGFVFFTNYDSRKGDELSENTSAALVFHWPVIERQIRVEGSVEKVSEEASFAYFKTRPHGSQIGAWASPQSSVLENRGELEDCVRRYDKEYARGQVPLPPHWGGYCLRPRMIEFWQGRANRLHDRIRYTREGEGWTVDRLAP